MNIFFCPLLVPGTPRRSPRARAALAPPLRALPRTGLNVFEESCLVLTQLPSSPRRAPGMTVGVAPGRGAGDGATSDTHTRAAILGLFRWDSDSYAPALFSEERWNLVQAPACKDEGPTGTRIASADFSHELRALLEEQCIAGCSNFPSICSPRAYPRKGPLIIPGSYPTRALQTLSPLVQRRLGRGGALDPQAKATLSRPRRSVDIFESGFYAAAAKGSWRLARLSTVVIKTGEPWALRASLGAASMD